MHGRECIDNFNEVSEIYWKVREEMDMITKQMNVIDTIKEIRDEKDITFSKKGEIIFLKI